MECRFRYASKLGDSIFPTTKTAPHRHRQQLRITISTGWRFFKLPDTSCISTSKWPFRRSIPNTSHNDFRYPNRNIRYTDNVAGGSGKLLPRWLKASMGSWAGSDDRPIHVQEIAMSFGVSPSHKPSVPTCYHDIFPGKHQPRLRDIAKCDDALDLSLKCRAKFFFLRAFSDRATMEANGKPMTEIECRAIQDLTGQVEAIRPDQQTLTFASSRLITLHE